VPDLTKPNLQRNAKSAPNVSLLLGCPSGLARNCVLFQSAAANGADILEIVCFESKSNGLWNYTWRDVLISVLLYKPV
jgi:hypothetical protein